MEINEGVYGYNLEFFYAIKNTRRRSEKPLADVVRHSYRYDNYNVMTLSHKANEL